MRLSGDLIIAATIAAALTASEPRTAAAAGKDLGGVHPWYKYGYNFPHPYKATPPGEYPVTGRSVVAGEGPASRTYYCMYGYGYPDGCPLLWYDYPYGWPFVQ